MTSASWLAGRGSQCWSARQTRLVVGGMAKRAGEHASKRSRLRCAAAPGNNLVGTYQREICLIEIAQLARQCEELEIGTERASHLLQLAGITDAVIELEQRPLEAE